VVTLKNTRVCLPKLCTAVERGSVACNIGRVLWFSDVSHYHLAVAFLAVWLYVLSFILVWLVVWPPTDRCFIAVFFLFLLIAECVGLTLLVTVVLPLAIWAELGGRVSISARVQRLLVVFR